MKNINFMLEGHAKNTSIWSIVIACILISTAIVLTAISMMQLWRLRTTQSVLADMQKNSTKLQQKIHETTALQAKNKELEQKINKSQRYVHFLERGGQLLQAIEQFANQAQKIQTMQVTKNNAEIVVHAPSAASVMSLIQSFNALPFVKETILVHLQNNAQSEKQTTATLQVLFKNA